MSNGNAMALADVTDKANPRHLSRISHPNPAYMHQGWLTQDHRYFFMDDESDVNRGLVTTTRTLVWDVSDLENPNLALSHMGSLPAAAHNLYIKDNLMYQANYRYGLQIVDVSDPLKPVEVGHFDTSPHHDGPSWGGAWSNYPFFPSGTIIVTSMQEGLFVLRRRPPLP
jgi:choice-of-anchor B domain-containing protein